MNLADLDLRELLSFNPEGGVIDVLGERALLLNAFAIGHLRRDLIETLGMFGARNFLTRLGYANGWQTARNVHMNMPV